MFHLFIGWQCKRVSVKSTSTTVYYFTLLYYIMLYCFIVNSKDFTVEMIITKMMIHQDDIVCLHHST